MQFEDSSKFTVTDVATQRWEFKILRQKLQTLLLPLCTLHVLLSDTTKPPCYTIRDAGYITPTKLAKRSKLIFPGQAGEQMLIKLQTKWNNGRHGYTFKQDVIGWMNISMRKHVSALGTTRPNYNLMAVALTACSSHGHLAYLSLCSICLRKKSELLVHRVSRCSVAMTEHSLLHPSSATGEARRHDHTQATTGRPSTVHRTSIPALAYVRWTSILEP